MKVFLHPVIGSPRHVVVVADGGWTLSFSMCDQWEPEDDVRCAGYQLVWTCDYNHWREADEGETSVILKMMQDDDPEIFVQLAELPPVDGQGVSGS